jgi:hypothetical protein
MIKLLALLSLLLVQPLQAKTVYQCPMHPQIVRDAPGQCPICHMELEKVEMDEGHKHEAGAAPDPRAAFTLPAARQQLIGVKVTPAAEGPMVKTLRLSGRVNGGMVVAQLMEMDAGLVKSGQRAVLVGPGGQTVTATVQGVESNLDSVTRGFGVGLAPDRGAAWLRGGVYCEARVQVPLGKGLLLPAGAVLATGDQAVVFVRSKGDRFEPRQVLLGHQDEEWVEVTQGLKAGELVVTGANFLIDSEARFKAAIEAYR